MCDDETECFLVRYNSEKYWFILKVFNCTHGLTAPFCTKKSKLKIIVESLSDSNSEFQLHIEVTQSHSKYNLYDKPCRIHRLR